MAGRPNVNSDSQKELDKAERQFEKFDEDVKKAVADRDKPSVEAPEHKVSQKEVEKTGDLYLKPQRMIMCREKFNETYRDAYNDAKTYVHYTIQHEECRGENVEMWTKPFAGIPAEFWVIPSGKPVWIPKYVAEKLENGCGYHRLKTQDNISQGGTQNTQFYGTLVVDEYIHRISARPVTSRRSFSMHRP